MTDAGDKLLEGLKEAVAVAQGHTPAHRLYINGHTYVPVQELDAALLASHPGATRALIDKARALVDMLDDAERNHGALIGSKTLTAANELRIELSRWK